MNKSSFYYIWEVRQRPNPHGHEPKMNHTAILTVAIMSFCTTAQEMFCYVRFLFAISRSTAQSSAIALPIFCFFSDLHLGRAAFPASSTLVQGKNQRYFCFVFVFI